MSGAAIRFLEVRRPQLDADEAAEIAARSFGISARAEPIYSERDRNFRVDAPSGRYLLKVHNPADDEEVLDFQYSALRHIRAVAPDLPVPGLQGTRGRLRP